MDTGWNNRDRHHGSYLGAALEFVADKLMIESLRPHKSLLGKLQAGCGYFWRPL